MTFRPLSGLCENAARGISGFFQDWIRSTESAINDLLEGDTLNTEKEKS